MSALMVLLGLVVGSFLNVCIYRIPRGTSLVFPKSHCPFCKHALSSWDLVPVFSYIFSLGRCRYCNTSISTRYVLVELFSASIFFVTFFFMGNSPYLLKYLIFFSLLLIIFFIDLEHKIIPDELVLFLLLWGMVWQVLYPERGWMEAAGGALLGGGFLLLTAVISRGGMGGGDIKLMFASGFYLGIGMTGLALFLSFTGGAAVGLALLTIKMIRRNEYIPFGPFLTLGIISTVLWGSHLIEMYLRWVGLN